jgi:hypothetical protein
METGFDMRCAFSLSLHPMGVCGRRNSGPMSLSLGYPVQALAGKHCRLASSGSV